MTSPRSTETETVALSPEQMTSALFANLVIQQTNTALMLLGRVAHPETGEHMHDLEGARMFIDQLEMLEVKTKGNLDKREEQLLKQSLTTLRMAFVEAVEAPAQSARPASETSKPGTETAPPASVDDAGPSSEPAGESAESRKKFSKKY
jgi:hypothetical protein